MCFTPIVSLSTAIFEFVVAFIILIIFRQSKISKYFSIFIILLGCYQLTEYFLCTTLYPIFWAKIGFVIYTFLPILAFDFVVKISNIKFPAKVLYLLPLIFSSIALLNKNFIITSQCTNLFVLVESTFFNFSNILFPILYLIYYFVTIFVICYLIFKYYFSINTKYHKFISILILLSIIISLFGAIIFIILYPALSIMFPSIYCWFALIFSICGIIVCYLDNKYKS